MSPRPQAGLRARLVGLVAVVTLLLLLVGIPAALLTVAGNPLPASVPDGADVVDALRSPDDGSLFLGLLVVAGWVGWAGFAVSVLVEVAARARGRPAPQLPALRLQQRAAAGLVGAVAVLFTVSPAATAAPAAAAPPAAAAVAVAAHTPSAATALPAAKTRPASAAADSAVHGAEERTVVVRAGDSLWSIAERELGDGQRFPEIARLNYGRPQPDGETLRRDHWIRPGWTLALPARTAAGGGTPDGAGALYTVRRGDTLAEIAENRLGDADRYPEIARASRNITQPGGARLTDPDVIDVGWTLRLPAPAGDAPGAEQPPARPNPPPAASPRPAAPTAPPPAAPAAPTPTGHAATTPPAVSPTATATAAQPSQAAPAPSPALTLAPPPAPPEPPPTGLAPQADTAPDGDGDQAGERDLADADEGFPVRTAAGVGALLAAGVLGLVAARRTTQQRRRRHGQPMPLPTGPAAQVETDLRAVADPLGVDTVDLALRTLADTCAEQGQPLPVVRAARLTADQFDLYLAEPAALPSPWAGTADAAVWTLPADATATATADLLPAEQAQQVPAPYPSLVTIGHDSEDGHVFLDLEYVGALGVSGDPAGTRAVLAAVAVELATSKWADDLQVTIVGAHPELDDALQTGRIRYQPAVGRLLEDLAARAERDRGVLAGAGAPDLQHARASGDAAGAWTPEIVLFVGELTGYQRVQLEQLVDQLPRVAVAAVTSSGRPIGEWNLRLDDADTAVLEPIGLRLRPQGIDDHTYAHLLDVLATAAQPPANPAGHGPATDDEPALKDLPDTVDAPDTPATPAAPVGPPVTVTVTTRNPATPAGLAGLPAANPQRSSPEPAPDDRQQDRGPVGDQAGDQKQHKSGLEGDRRAQLKAQRRTRLTALRAGTTPPEEASDPPESGAGTSPAPDAPAPPEAGGPAASGALQPEPDTTRALGDPTATPATAEADEDAAEAAPPGSTPSSVLSERSTDGDGDLTYGEGPGQLARRAPRILVLGPVEVGHAAGPIEPSKRNRLTELAAYLALHPGVDHPGIDAALWPGTRVNANARNTAMSKLRRWLGKEETGEDHLPRYQSETRYQLGPHVTTDWHIWQHLLPEGAARASTEHLEQALTLVRGQPFDGVASRRYAWAENHKQIMISAIVDAAYELAKRRLMEGHWRAAEQAVITGLTVEPGMERLWRLRLLAARSSGNRAAEKDAVARLLAVADDLGGDLEDETEQLLAQLRDNPSRELAAHAL